MWAFSKNKYDFFSSCTKTALSLYKASSRFTFLFKVLKMASIILEPSSHSYSHPLHQTTTTNPFFSSKFHYPNNNASKFYPFPSNSTVFLTLSTTPNNITHTRSCSRIDSPSITKQPDPVMETGLDPTRDRRRVVRVAWEKLVRWSRSWRSKSNTDVLQRTNKVCLFSSLSCICCLFSLCCGLYGTVLLLVSRL